ncbi:MAG: alpha/beta fold hydrolase [Tabrizicola sp.]|nr:alpha/beta fold hydrolase [Tabrizicola sp.]
MRPACLTAFAFLLAAAPALAEPTLAERLDTLGAAPCENALLTCVTLPVPRDHRANDPDQTLDITFAVSLATEESLGQLFLFVGGPGVSGVSSAEDYLLSFDESFTQYMDVVFLDQRGTGPDHGLSCPVAQAGFETAEAGPDQAETMVAAARSFVADCVTEMDAGDFLGLVTTDQTIRDVELFRQAIGAPKVWLYGESYGTQVAQQYATAFPDAVRGVILDGVVDLTLDAEAYYATYTRASEKLLERLFAACDALPECVADMQGSARAVYDDLAEKLRQAAMDVDFVLGDGRVVTRKMTAEILETNAYFALYGPDGRSEFLRALAAAGRGRLVPMLQLGYANAYIDPQTEAPQEDPTWFGAAYYAILCSDYASGPGLPEERAARISQEAVAFASEAPRLQRLYVMERLACAFWPHQGEPKRPEPFAGGDYPTLVLNGDGDPITPVSMAYSVLDNARTSFGVFMQGGPHVIWGRGLPCPDEIVAALLYDDRLPVAKEQQCRQDFIGDYVALTLTDPADATDPLILAQAVDTELLQSVELGGWYGDQTASFGCEVSGSFTAEPGSAGTNYRFRDCAFWPGIVLNGSGEDGVDGNGNEGIHLDLTVSGAYQGSIAYFYGTLTEAWSITGTQDGKTVGIARTYP